MSKRTNKGDNHGTAAVKASRVFMILFGFLAICFSTLSLQAGSVVVDGTTWTLTADEQAPSGPGLQTYLVTLEADT